MAEDDIFSELEDRTQEAGGSGDYADWWSPSDDDPEELVGVIMEKHSEPRDWTDPGEVPGVVNTVVSVGRGGFDAGVTRTPRQHTQLMQALEGAEIGDLVRLVFTGYEKVNGNRMLTYEAAIIPREEWEELGGADDIEEVLEEYDGPTGDNTRETPYAEDDGGSSSGGSGGSGDDDTVEAAGVLSDLIDVQGGSMELDQADQILNDVRGLGVDVEEAAVMAGLSVDDGEITG